jgi:hypothetical protein
VALILVVSIHTFLYRSGWLEPSYPNALFSLISWWTVGLVLLVLLGSSESGVRKDSLLFRCAALGLCGIIIGYFWVRLEAIFPDRLTGGMNLNRQLMYLGTGLFLGVATGFMKRKAKAPYDR